MVGKIIKTFPINEWGIKIYQKWGGGGITEIYFLKLNMSETIES